MEYLEKRPPAEIMEDPTRSYVLFAIIRKRHSEAKDHHEVFVKFSFDSPTT